MTSTDVPPGHGGGTASAPTPDAPRGGARLRATVGLGLRLAVRARPSRSALVVVGSALATGLLLTVVGAYQVGASAQASLSGDDKRLLLTVVAAVACPVVVLLMTAARLSSTSRDARAAALARLGVSRRRLRVLAAAENATLALVGAIVGLVLHLLVLAPGFGAIAAKLRWFNGLEPRATALGAVATIAATVLAAAAAGYLPQRTARPGAAVRTASARPTWWRLAPVALGTVLLGIAVAVHGNSDASPTDGQISVFFGGGVLAILGLPIALPVAVRLVGDLAGRAPNPSLVIAGRGLQAEPATTTRLVAAVLASLAVVTGAFCVLQAFWDVPQVQRPQIADSTGPQLASIWLDPTAPAPSPGAVAQLERTSGVRAAVALPDAWLESAPGDCERQSESDALCGQAFVGTCADLSALAGQVDGCSDDALAVITTSDEAFGGTEPWDAASATWIRSGSADGATSPAPVRLPPVTGRITIGVDDGDPFRAPQYSVFVPTALATTAVLVPSEIALVLDGGPAGRDPVAAEARRLGLVFAAEDLSELRRVQGYEAMVWAVGAVMLATGLAGLAIAGADGATERRRRLASLWVVGTPTRVIQRSQLFRNLLPLVIGAPLAAVVGGLVGVAYLSLGDIAARFPWQQTGALLAITVAVAALTSLVTLSGLGQRPSADLLRRE